MSLNFLGAEVSVAPCLALAVLLASWTVLAGDPPPPKPPAELSNWRATMKVKPSTGIKMGSLLVRYEATTLDDVLTFASTGHIAHEGDAGESAYWICYTAINAQHRERIWLVSHGEMGSAEHRITRIAVSGLKRGQSTAGCASLPLRMKPLSLSGGLWLGDSANKVAAALGTPSFQRGTWKYFNYVGKSRAAGTCAGAGFDVTNWLAVRLLRDRVDAIHSGQITSC